MFLRSISRLRPSLSTSASTIELPFSQSRSLSSSSSTPPTPPPPPSENKARVISHVTLRSPASNKLNDYITCEITGTLPLNGYGICAGQWAEVSRVFSQEDVLLFAAVTGDYNPIHFDFPLSDDIDALPDSPTSNHKPIVPGALISSLYPTLIGTLLPTSIYRSQTLKYHIPVYLTTLITARVDITSIKRLRTGVLIRFDTMIYRCNDGGVVVSGEAECFCKDGDEGEGEGVRILGEFVPGGDEDVR